MKHKIQSNMLHVINSSCIVILWLQVCFWKELPYLCLCLWVLVKGKLKLMYNKHSPLLMCTVTTPIQHFVTSVACNKWVFSSSFYRKVGVSYMRFRPVYQLVLWCYTMQQKLQENIIIIIITSWKRAMKQKGKVENEEDTSEISLLPSCSVNPN